MIKILDTNQEPLCGLFYTPEELDEEFEPEKTETQDSSLNLYALHQQAFFAYGSGATMEDWNKCVESDPGLVEVRKKYQEVL